MSVEARSADDGIEGLDGTLLDVLENSFENAVDFVLAAVKEAGRMGVTVDGRTIGDLVHLRDLAWTVPANEVAVDGVAVGMRADTAAAGVAREIGREVGGSGSK